MARKDSESEGESEDREAAHEDAEQQFNVVLSRLLESMLNGPLSLIFSGMTDHHLTELGVSFAGVFRLKSDLEERIKATTSLAENELWSSAGLYRQLHLLAGLLVIPTVTEPSRRIWIDPFFFRASAMVPAGQRMVLLPFLVTTTSTSPSSVSTPDGTIDYSAVIATQGGATVFNECPTFNIIRSHMPSGFLVTEAKVVDISAHVPQAIGEMYAFGRLLKKEVLRGALTNGHQWIFLLLKFSDDNEASYNQSEVVQININDHGGKPVVVHPGPDLIAAILLHWIRNSFNDFRRDDDWFEALPPGHL